MAKGCEGSDSSKSSVDARGSRVRRAFEAFRYKNGGDYIIEEEADL